MTSVYQLKPRFQAVLRPLVGALAAVGVTANQVTLTAAAGSLAIGFLVGLNSAHRPVFLLVAVWLPVRMALNAIEACWPASSARRARSAPI